MTTTRRSIVAVIGTGDMGSAVGKALVRAGYRVVTAGVGRSELSRRLAAAAGIEDLGSLEQAVRGAGLVLSIVPPATATSFAADVARALATAATRPTFVDCNAVAPATVLAIERTIGPTRAAFADCGIRAQARLRNRCLVQVLGGESRPPALDLLVPAQIFRLVRGPARVQLGRQHL